MAEMTSADLQMLTFSKPGIGRRGYDESEVDAFIDRVGETLMAVEQERKRSWVDMQVAMPAAEVSPAATPPSYPPMSVATSYMTISTPESPAVEVAPDPAAAAVGKVLVIAQEAADKITADAEQGAQMVLSVADGEAARILREATVEVTNRLARAQDVVEVLEGRIVKLRAFEAAYRARIEEFMKDQLMDLAGVG